MLTKGFVLVVVAIGVLLAVGGSWGIAVAVSSHTGSVPMSSAAGVPGKAGSNGKNGADGVPGVIGTPGSNGTDGATSATPARGLAGAQGVTGPQGPAGPAGPSGASAPTFSAISAAGQSIFDARGFTFPTQTALVPTGPALVGFSVGIQNTPFEPFPVTCSLVDANDPTTVFATTADLTIPFPPAFSTFAATQVVDLTSPTSLTVQCTTDPPLFSFNYNYEDLSIYAISFAP